MMMPANYSVIAENELSYVEGGASFIDWIGDRTATVWTAANVKTFNTNVVTIVGNAFVDNMVHSTLGVLFSGQTTWKEVGNIGKNLFGTNVHGNKIEKNNFGDYAMNALGIAAAVYNLGVAPTKNTVKEKDLTFSKTVKATV